MLKTTITESGMSKRASSGNPTVTGVYASYLYKMIEGLKTHDPEVKDSKSDKWLRSYDHSKFYMCSYVHIHLTLHRCLLAVILTSLVMIIFWYIPDFVFAS